MLHPFPFCSIRCRNICGIAVTADYWWRGWRSIPISRGSRRKLSGNVHLWRRRSCAVHATRVPDTRRLGKHSAGIFAAGRRRRHSGAGMLFAGTVGCDIRSLRGEGVRARREVARERDCRVAEDCLRNGYSRREVRHGPRRLLRRPLARAISLPDGPSSEPLLDAAPAAWLEVSGRTPAIYTAGSYYLQPTHVRAPSDRCLRRPVCREIDRHV